MLTIRKEQIAVLSVHMLKRFEDRMVKEIRRDFPEPARTMSEEQTRGLIQTAITKGAAWQIDLEGDLARLIGLMVLRGPNFEKAADVAWCGEILDDQELPGTAKLDLIEHQLATKQQANG